MAKAKPLPPLNVLRELFVCDANKGVLTWKVRKPGRQIGDVAGFLNQTRGKKYLQLCVTINGKQSTYFVHRVIWMLVTGEDPGEWEIDHVDGNGLNNSFANLRKSNRSQNTCNSRIRINNTSGFKGVSYCKQTKKWKARIKINGHQTHLGRFNTPELAHMAYCKAAAELHGEFARGQ